MREFIRRLPKAELHLHIEGTLEPELMFALARRNRVKLPYRSIGAVTKAYRFQDLESFLDVYYRAVEVLRTSQDFFDLAWAYLQRVHQQNVRHVEIFFDPQAHTGRGIPFSVVLEGLQRALRRGQAELKMSSRLIMCFLRHLDERSAFETLEQAMPYRSEIIGIGLDSAEVGHPPRAFERVFAKGRELGYLTVAHAGEEGPPDYIWEALNRLNVSRIDHGVRALEDKDLIERLRCERIPLTVCPLSNVKLGVFDKLEDHNLKRLLDAGLCVTVNSDDPAYFGGYIEDNYIGIQDALKLDRPDMVALARNSFTASFIGNGEKRGYFEELGSLR